MICWWIAPAVVTVLAALVVGMISCDPAIPFAAMAATIVGIVLALFVVMTWLVFYGLSVIPGLSY